MEKNLNELIEKGEYPENLWLLNIVIFYKIKKLSYFKAVSFSIGNNLSIHFDHKYIIFYFLPAGSFMPANEDLEDNFYILIKLDLFSIHPLHDKYILIEQRIQTF